MEEGEDRDASSTTTQRRGEEGGEDEATGTIIINRSPEASSVASTLCKSARLTLTFTTHTFDHRGRSRHDKEVVLVAKARSTRKQRQPGRVPSCLLTPTLLLSPSSHASTR